MTLIVDKHYHHLDAFDDVPDFTTVVAILEKETRYSHLTVYPTKYAHSFICLWCLRYESTCDRFTYTYILQDWFPDKRSVSEAFLEDKGEFDN